MNQYNGQKTVVPSRVDFNEGDVIINRYRVESVLGEGTFGKVYKVSAPDNTSHALKILRLWEVPSDIREPLMNRFENEFKTGRISCRNLVHSIDFGFIAGNPYILMEYCSGGDLSRYLGDSRIDILSIATDILDGLDALHINGKVHRDLKPENVLLKEDMTAVLTDFGIAGDRRKRMTERSIFGKPYQTFGTYAYMPPEQVNRMRGESTVMPTTDIFSFGVLLYQMITGLLPFGRLDNHNDLVKYQKRGKCGDWDRDTLRGTRDGKQWERLIEGCLQPDYKHRLKNVAEVKRLMPNNTPEVRYADVPERPRIETAGNLPEDLLMKIIQGVERGKVYDLSQMMSQIRRRMLTAGRDENNDIQFKDFDDLYTSRYHFTIERDSNDNWVIRDGQWVAHLAKWQNSSNGTYVNSTRISNNGTVLQRGDIITVGGIKIKLEPKNN